MKRISVEGMTLALVHCAVEDVAGVEDATSARDVTAVKNATVAENVTAVKNVTGAGRPRGTEKAPTRH